MEFSLNQATEPLTFLLVLSSDHLTGATGKTPAVTLSKNGGPFASPAGAVAEIGNGWYQVVPTAADFDTLGPLLLHATAAGADPVDDRHYVETEPAAVVPSPPPAPAPAPAPSPAPPFSPLTIPGAAASQRMILVQLGQTTNADFVFLVSSLWAQNASSAQSHPRLPYLYTFRDAVRARIAQLAERKVDFTGPGGVGQKNSQQISNLEKLIAPDSLFGSELAQILTQIGVATGTATGELTKQAPIETPAGYPDPNSRAFRGDPFVRAGR